MTDGSLFNINDYGTPAVSEPDVASEASAPSVSGPTSLYRKYRPQSFEADDLFGQDHVVNTLRNAIALDRIAHAYLFCGPRGTGKTTTARILAKAANCLDPDPHKRPCNVCANCRAINAGATTDVIEIDAASNRGIDDIRDLRERVKYAPSQLKTKFYIIDEAHQITGAAANAFLKTLEEPPAHTKFVLATTDPEDLLQTIVSRCQRFDFRRINLEAMVANLTKIAKAEGFEIDDDAKLMIARHATGSLRDAQGLLDQVAVYRENALEESPRITVDLVRNVLGVSKNDRVYDIAQAIAHRDPGVGVRAIGDAVSSGDDMRQLARQLLAYMRELLLQRAGGQSDLDDQGKALAAEFDLADLAEITRRLGEIDFKVKHATISQLPLEIAVVETALRTHQLAATPVSQPSAPAYAANANPHQPAAAPQRPQPRQPEPQSQPQEPRPSLMDRVRGDRSPRPGNSTQPRQQPEPARRPTNVQQRSGESYPSEQASSARPTPTAGTAAGGSADIDTLRDRWLNIKNDVKAINRRIEALLQQIDPVAVQGNRVTLASGYEFHRNRVNQDEIRTVIEDVISRHVGARVSIICVTRDEVPGILTPSQPAPASGRTPAPEQRHSEPAAEPQGSFTAATDAGGSATVESFDDEPVTDPPPAINLEKQITAIKNIFDAEEDQ